MKNWKDEPITSAQLKALENKTDTFGLTWGKHGKPKTKGEAEAQFKRVDSLIAQIKMGLESPNAESNIFQESHYIDIGDFIDPIF